MVNNTEINSEFNPDIEDTLFDTFPSSSTCTLKKKKLNYTILFLQYYIYKKISRMTHHFYYFLTLSIKVKISINLKKSFINNICKKLPIHYSLDLI